MVPSIWVHRPSNENVVLVDTFNDSIAGDESLMQDSGVRPRENDEMMDPDDFGMNEVPNIHRPRKMSAREERMKWWRIYAMHFLFSWNSRTFEYVSVARILPCPRSTAD
jgi:hypothetical protein